MYNCVHVLGIPVPS